MLLDARGRELVRRKHYGLVTGPLEYVLAEPPAAEALVDAIGNEFIAAPDDDQDEGSIT